MQASRAQLTAKYRRIHESSIGAGRCACMLLINALACALGSLKIGGFAMWGEVYDGRPFFPFGGERVWISWPFNEFTFWHAASVFLLMPVLVLFTVWYLVERIRMVAIRRALDRRDLLTT